MSSGDSPLGTVPRLSPPSGLVFGKLRCVSSALDSVLFERLREILGGGNTTEAELRELTDEAGGWVRGLRGQVRASEQRLRALNRDPTAPIATIADELRRVEALRPQL